MNRGVLLAGMVAGIVLSVAAGLVGAALLSLAGLLAAMVLFASWVEAHPTGPAALLDDEREQRHD